ncbi:MAG: AAA family ATPase [Planctomycetia bacterium]|nr:AAA family ATPase [Planctomycetia bacterium]
MLRIESVNIKWFRGIREGSISGLTDVNVLVGRNNCGKTTVVEAILRLAASGSGEPRDALGRNRDAIVSTFRNEASPIEPSAWHQSDQSRPIEIAARISDEAEKNAVVHHWIGTVSPKTPYEEHGVSRDQAKVFLKGIAFFHPADARDQRVERNVWPQLLATRKDKSLTRALNNVFALNADGFQLLPDQSLMVLFENAGVRLDGQGDGTRAALRALVLLATRKSTIFILEEPESHQHPGSLERFAQALCKQAREQQVQLILSTHSGECVRAFLKGAEAAQSEAAVFHLTLEDGKFDARRLDAEAVETLQGTGIDVRALDLYA